MVKNCPIIKFKTIFRIYRFSAFQWCLWIFSILILSALKINLKKTTSRARNRSFGGDAAVENPAKKMVKSLVKNCPIIKFKTIFGIYRFSAFQWCLWIFPILILSALKINFKKTYLSRSESEFGRRPGGEKPGHKNGQKHGQKLSYCQS